MWQCCFFFCFVFLSLSLSIVWYFWRCQMLYAVENFASTNYFGPCRAPNIRQTYVAFHALFSAAVVVVTNVSSSLIQNCVYVGNFFFFLFYTWAQCVGIPLAIVNVNDFHFCSSQLCWWSLTFLYALQMWFDPKGRKTTLATATSYYCLLLLFLLLLLSVLVLKLGYFSCELFEEKVLCLIYTKCCTCDSIY